MADEKTQDNKDTKAVDKPKYLIAIGRRKSAVARVKLQAGTGKMKVNKKPADEYFTVLAHRVVLRQPLTTANLQKQIDIEVQTRGGGVRAQADAARLGIARALIVYDKELRPALKTAGYLCRDSREKERKKPGLKGARRAPQFSKR